MDIQEILNQGNYHLIDVREPEELIANGAIEGAENIPLGEVENHADEKAERLRKRLNREDLPMSITAEATRIYLNCYNS